MSGVPIRHLHIVYDNDTAGRGGAADMERVLRAGGLPASARILPVDLGQGGDVDDLHRRVGDDGLAAALAALPALAPSQAAPPAWQKVLRPLADILNEPVPDTSWLVKGLIPRGWPGLLTADSKTGKTLLAFDLARAVSTGGIFLGQQAMTGAVILALADDPPALSRKRLRALAGCPDVYVSIDRWTPITREAISQAVADMCPALVVIDTLVKAISSVGGDENDSSSMDAIMEAFSSWSSNEKTTVILIHHLNRGGTARGSTAIVSAAPFEMRLERVKQDDEDDSDQGERLVKLSWDWKLEPVEPMMLTYRGDCFEMRGSPAQAQHNKLVAAALRFIGDIPGRTSTDIARAMKARIKTVTDLLHTLREQNRLEARIRLPEGKGRPSLLWFITGSYVSDGKSLPLYRGKEIDNDDASAESDAYEAF